MKATFRTTRPATLKDIEKASERLHPRSEAELVAAGYETPAMGLFVLVATTENVYVVGDHLAICGVRNQGDQASVWVVLCRDAERHGMDLLRWSRRAVEDLLDDGFDIIYTNVYAENLDVLRWVTWLGFHVLPARAMEPSGELFHRVELRRK